MRCQLAAVSNNIREYKRIEPTLRTRNMFTGKSGNSLQGGYLQRFK